MCHRVNTATAQRACWTQTRGRQAEMLCWKPAGLVNIIILHIYPAKIWCSLGTRTSQCPNHMDSIQLIWCEILGQCFFNANTVLEFAVLSLSDYFFCTKPWLNWLKNLHNPHFIVILYISHCSLNNQSRNPFYLNKVMHF